MLTSTENQLACPCKDGLDGHREHWCWGRRILAAIYEKSATRPKRRDSNKSPSPAPPVWRADGACPQWKLSSCKTSVRRLATSPPPCTASRYCVQSSSKHDVQTSRCHQRKPGPHKLSEIKNGLVQLDETLLPTSLDKHPLESLLLAASSVAINLEKRSDCGVGASWSPTRNLGIGRVPTPSCGFSLWTMRLERTLSG